jgi:predicted short-subunit dehydrogenase-like oxidoreductase (DUF2520 family)
MKGIVIIGAGRLGTALARALSNAGLSIRAMADPSSTAASRARRLVGRRRVFRDNVQAAGEGHALFLCVPDSTIAVTAQELASSGIAWRGKVVFHCSGLLPSSILGPLRRRGAWTASCHPVRSFPARGAQHNPFRGIPVGVEGQARAIAWLGPVLRRLGAEPFVLRPADKPLYHAACSLASNHVVALLDMARGLLVGAGFPKKKALAVLLPLTQGTLHDVNKVGTEAALTGPIVRGDVRTVQEHLAALKKAPEVREAYKTLGRRALRLAEKTVEAGKVKALRRLLEGK